MASRIIHHADGLTWLKNQPVATGSSFITSLPDVSEFPHLSLSEWKKWFINAASLILSRCPDDGMTIFFQSDIKVKGVWIDKGFLCQKAAEEMGHELIAHKIASRVAPGAAAFGKPGYSHLLCFSKAIRPEIKKSSADILPECGEKTWTRGMGLKVCRAAVNFVKTHTQSNTVIDPFCGHGLVLAVANEYGLDGIGVEIGRKRAEKSRAIEVPK